MNDHDHEFPDELISAYLDGELSPAEKLRVEEQLMDSAEHRRLFEELKALRRSLQALPAEALGEDFAARVLRRAERELLAEGPGAEKSKRLEPTAAAEATDLKSETSPASPVEKHVTVVRSSSQADRVSRRGLIWSIIATAAAVGFLIYGPLLNQQNSQVSQLNEEARETTTAKPLPDPATSEAQPMAKESAESPPVAARQRFELQTNSAAPFNAGAEPQSSPRPDNEFALRNAEMAKQEANQATDDVFGGNGNRFGQGPAERRAPTATTAAPKDRAGEGGAVDGESAERSMIEKIARGDGAVGKAGNAEGYFAPQTTGGGGRIASATIPTRGRQAKPQVAAAPAMSVVTVDVKREALSAKFFDSLLARHDIQVELASAEKGQNEQLDQDAQVAAAESLNDAAVTDKVEAEEQVRADGVAAALGGEASGKADHEDVDLMYVVATQAQIDGLLRDLQSHHGDVVALTYGDEILAKNNFWANADALEAERQLHNGVKLNEVEQLNVAPLAEVASEPAIAADAREAPSGVKPSVQRDDSSAASAVAGDSPEFAAARELKSNDLKLAESKKSGFARRLSLQEQQSRANLAARSEGRTFRASPPADIASQSVQDEATAAADSVAEAQGDAPKPLAADAAPADSPAEVAPAAPLSTPQAAQLNGAGDKMAKAKEQGLVRVLFVLRAVSPAPEAPPAEPAAPPEQ